MDRDFMLGILVLGIVLISAVTVVVLPKLKKKQQPNHHDPYINQYNQPNPGVIDADHITSDTGSDSS
ncbi:hypothetical protein [Laceyella putida]|uniref:YtzI protein n=1 Tax=Laceyella putida TaxID=110101 RepID=A0ABW2RMG6_9BACL